LRKNNARLRLLLPDRVGRRAARRDDCRGAGNGKYRRLSLQSPNDGPPKPLTTDAPEGSGTSQVRHPINGFGCLQLHNVPKNAAKQAQESSNLS
jgi:hypothetical protein